MITRMDFIATLLIIAVYFVAGLHAQNVILKSYVSKIFSTLLHRILWWLPVIQNVLKQLLKGDNMSLFNIYRNE
jgi:uncharacterized membrane protein